MSAKGVPRPENRRPNMVRTAQRQTRTKCVSYFSRTDHKLRPVTVQPLRRERVSHGMVPVLHTGLPVWLPGGRLNNRVPVQTCFPKIGLSKPSTPDGCVHKQRTEIQLAGLRELWPTTRLSYSNLDGGSQAVASRMAANVTVPISS